MVGAAVGAPLGATLGATLLGEPLGATLGAEVGLAVGLPLLVGGLIEVYEAAVFGLLEEDLTDAIFSGQNETWLMFAIATIAFPVSRAAVFQRAQNCARWG